jgi:transposase-like protein
MRRGEVAERWRTIIAEQARSGLSVAEFCRRRELTQVSFYPWCRKLQNAEACKASFIPVTLTGTVPVSIELPCGAVVRVPPEDDQALTRILTLLLAAPERQR